MMTTRDDVSLVHGLSLVDELVEWPFRVRIAPFAVFAEPFMAEVPLLVLWFPFISPEVPFVKEVPFEAVVSLSKAAGGAMVDERRVLRTDCVRCKDTCPL